MVVRNVGVIRNKIKGDIIRRDDIAVVPPVFGTAESDDAVSQRYFVPPVPFEPLTRAYGRLYSAVYCIAQRATVSPAFPAVGSRVHFPELR